MKLNKPLIVLFVALLPVFGFIIQPSSVSGDTPGSPASGKNGMVSSAHPIATRAGLTILQNGGNAFDAAVAVAATLNVVEPMMSGIGGYGTILVYDAKTNKIRFLDSSGKIPVGTDSDKFRSPTPNYRQNRRGPMAVSTPGNVNAWEAMSKLCGKLKWEKLFDPAIKAAEEGFVLDKRIASFISHAYESFPDYAKEFYGSNGHALKVGETLVQKDLAKSLRLIAKDGAKAVYGGEIGKKIDQAMRESGGFLALKDLIDDKAEWWEPIHINYRGYDVYTASPPSTAFPSLIRLGLMKQFEVKKMGHNSIEMLHTFIESTKYAFQCRLKYAGDPEISPPPLDKLLSEEFLKSFTDNIDPDKAKPFIYPGAEESHAQHTTHFVVVDSEGNIVSATQTLGNSFGSRIMPKGTGIWLNNSLAYCTFEPKGNPMDAHAGRRKLSGDCPTIILKDGTPWVALGTPGGHTIGQTVPQMVMNLIDFEMNILDAIAAPRVSFIEPDKIAIEAGIANDIRSALASKGHNVIVTKGGLGNAHGLMILYDNNGKIKSFFGGADPRGAGLAKGF